MTKEENCTYQLIRSALASGGFSGKLPKTIVTVKWVQRLKKALTASYVGCTIEAYNRIDNKWNATVLFGESLDRAVKFMLIREISVHGCIIMRNPIDLPLVHHTECVRDIRWVINSFLPSKFTK
jgi:hypothetical protein